MMTQNRFQFDVASDIDYEDLISNIVFDDKRLATITQEEGFDKLNIKIYPPTNNQYWEFSLEDFLAVIQQVRHRLFELRKTDDADD